mmetsp:Transcript_18511/g.46384  ORF Transcript_18511/g.46384 Transcript_18511/m.46384 type:complete len:224 (+) Transcript_18511:23-694(+)
MPTEGTSMSRRSPRLQERGSATVSSTAVPTTPSMSPACSLPAGGASISCSAKPSATTTGLAPQVGRMMTDESIKTSVLCMGARTTTSNASAAVVPTSLEELRRLALQMGCVLEPISKWARTVAHSVATALRTREGDFIYQSAALRIVEMPRDAAVAIFPTPKRSSPQEMCWELTSASETAAFFQNLLPLSGMQTAGATRAIQRPSEPVIRVMATMMGGICAQP